MTLQSTSYFQSTQNHSALLLQHYQISSIPLCLACICDAKDPAQGKAAAYLTEQLLCWFRDLPWKKLTRNPEKHLPRIEQQLYDHLSNIAEELTTAHLLSSNAHLSIAGILVIDEHFLLFLKGTSQIYLLNRSFNRGAIQCVSDEIWKQPQARIVFRQGLLQPDVGLLLATESFCSCADKRELQECLYVKDMQSADRAQRHLHELGRRSEVRGGRNMGAVLIQTLIGCE